MRLVFLGIFSLILASCSSKPTVYNQLTGVSCYQNAEQAQKDEFTCIKIPSYRDPVKWHRVNSWDVQPKIPPIP